MASLNAVFRLNDGYSRVINSINRSTLLAEKNIMGASQKVDKLNSSLSNTNQASNLASGGIKKLISALGGLFALKQGMAITDEFINTQSRIANMNDGLQSTKEVQDDIYRAAQRSRGAYDAMAASVAKLGTMAGDAFGSTKEIVDFTELVQKSFRVGGASKGEQQAGMYQLSQAMASGRLQGDEFRSISENAPMITKALSQSLGVSIGKLKEMSSEGVLTADVIKKAMFDMADDINSQFEKMPMTFADVGTQIKNHAIYTFQGVMQSANDILNSDNMQNFVNFFRGGIDIIAQAVMGLVQMIDWIATAVSNAWVIIEPMLLAAAFLLLPIIVALLWSMIPPILTAAGAFLMAAAPIMMIVLIVGLVIFALNQMGITTGAIVGSMTGSFMYLGAIIYNVFAMCYNVASSFAEFLLNVFRNPLGAVKALFYDMGIYVNQIFAGIARQIDKLLNSISKFTGHTSDLAGWFEGNIATLQKEVDKIKSKEDYINLPKMEFKDVNGAYNKGYNWGNNAISGLGSGGIQPPGGIGEMNTNLGDYMTGGALPVTNGGSGGSGKLNVSIDKEDIKYLKDIAERDYVNKYTSATLAPNVTVQFGDVHETADANQMVGVIEKILREEIATVQEG